MKEGGVQHFSLMTSQGANANSWFLYPATKGQVGRWKVIFIICFKVLERLTYVTLVQCKLETGRTHQIRAHFKHIGHPLFNDLEYDGNKILKGTTFTKYKQFVQNCFKICTRQALHAQSLGFLHPTTSKEVNFDSELAEDMQQLIEKWRAYAKHQITD